MANITLKTRVDTQELDEAIEETIEKANRLVELLREASSLASSLAEKQTAPSVESQGQTTKKYFLHGTKEQSGEDRKNLANAIREILLDQSKGG